MKIANCTIEDFEEIVKLYKQARAYQTHLKMVVWPIFPEEMILQEIAEKRKLITPPRGIVYDRFSKKIVTNKTYYNLMMVEADIKNFDTNRFAKLII